MCEDYVGGKSALFRSRAMKCLNESNDSLVASTGWEHPKLSTHMHMQYLKNVPEYTPATLSCLLNYPPE